MAIQSRLQAVGIKSSLLVGNVYAKLLAVSAFQASTTAGKSKNNNNNKPKRSNKNKNKGRERQRIKIKKDNKNSNEYTIIMMSQHE